YGDLQDRLSRGRQERQAAKLTWETIQRIELSPTATAACELVDQAAQSMGCAPVQIGCARPGSPVPNAWDDRPTVVGPVSWPSAIFRLSPGQGRWITVSLGPPADAPLAADIVFRSMHRIGQALAERLERISTVEPGGSRPDPESAPA